MINLSGNRAPRPGTIYLWPSLNTEVENPRLKNGVGVQVVFQPDLPPGDHARQKAFARIEPSVHYMMQHLTESLNVAMLSARVGLSHSTFFAFFKTATGRTPIDFLICTRMDLAARLLEETHLQIKAVAGLLGYDDQFYFSRLFKSVHGLAPRKYRASKGGESNWNLKPKGSMTTLDASLVSPAPCKRNNARCWQISFAANAPHPKVELWRESGDASEAVKRKLWENVPPNGGGLWK